jgi:hypothetical protein
LPEPRFGLCGFLIRMAVLMAIGYRYFFGFISRADLRMVDTHNGDADWLSSPFLELRRLIYKVIFNTGRSA